MFALLTSTPVTRRALVLQEGNVFNGSDEVEEGHADVVHVKGGLYADGLKALAVVSKTGRQHHTAKTCAQFVSAVDAGFRQNSPSFPPLHVAIKLGWGPTVTFMLQTAPSQGRAPLVYLTCLPSSAVKRRLSGLGGAAAVCLVVHPRAQTYVLHSPGSPTPNRRFEWLTCPF